MLPFAVASEGLAFAGLAIDPAAALLYLILIPLNRPDLQHRHDFGRALFPHHLDGHHCFFFGRSAT